MQGKTDAVTMLLSANANGHAHISAMGIDRAASAAALKGHAGVIRLLQSSMSTATKERASMIARSGRRPDIALMLTASGE